ncbi:MAG: hypothetical protein E3J43_01600 [Candidatus Heimdallarchaeota archaeon]|nr:MAG: hypothetical protein E3J43_01600 [Candidatus Heimdallarchaeota archaeon]
MIDFGFKFRPPIVQSALAGISNRNFCQEILRYGAGMVTLGGFSIDYESHKATIKMIERGRKEFVLPTKQKNARLWCMKNLDLEKLNKHQSINVNIRFSKVDNLTKMWLKKFTEFVDFIEINAHCRQEEIINTNGGQSLLINLESLECLLNDIRAILPAFPLGIKIRGYLVNEYQIFVRILDEFSISFIHSDAMLPGHNRANIKIIHNLVNSTDIPIIGNNSVKTIKDIKTMFEAGAKAVSVARPLIRDPKFIQRLIRDYTGQKNHGSNNNSL